MKEIGKKKKHAIKLLILEFQSFLPVQRIRLVAYSRRGTTPVTNLLAAASLLTQVAAIFSTRKGTPRFVLAWVGALGGRPDQGLARGEWLAESAYPRHAALGVKAHRGLHRLWAK